MAGTVYALLVGINDYKPPINALYGCRNDVEALAAFLRGRLGDRVDLRVLVDGEATRDGLVAAFADHLGRAGPGDVALFAFSGHGTEEPAPPQFAPLEPSGRIQVLVCADTGRRVGPKLVRGLADKELAVLLEQVASGGGHVAVVLDCCHSGSGTRDTESRARQWRPDAFSSSGDERVVAEELASARDLGDFLPGVVDGWSAPPAGARGVLVGAASSTHVALSACESFEVAKEQPVDGAVRGAFSVALLGALEGLGARPTYRSVLGAARAAVERATAEQTPTLYPVERGGLADAVFLDGTLAASVPTYQVTPGEGGWFVDAGALHGLRAPAAGQEYHLACTAPDGTAAGLVRVVAVEPGRSRVEPIGWEPTATAYEAVVAVVPLPPATVSVEGDPAAARLVEAALATAGPGGGPSPHVRLAGPDVAPAGLHLRVAAYPDGYTVERLDGSTRPVPGAWFRILRADGTPATADVAGTDEAAARAVVDRLEHLARWDLLLHLGDHPSRLRDAVALDVFVAEPGETAFPEDRPPLTPDGGYHLAYRGTRPEDHPVLFLQLRNTADRDLYVALLDFTDQYACHTALFPAARIAAGHTVRVWDGQPIPVQLPDDRPVEAGARVRDWLRIVVSDQPFDASAFQLGSLGEPVTRAVPAPPGRTTLEQLAGVAATRMIGGGGPPPKAVDWAAVTVPVVTTVPS